MATGNFWTYCGRTGLCLFTKVRYRIIRVPKVPFRFFDKLKKEIQNSILRFCFYFNKEDEIQITDYHFHV